MSEVTITGIFEKANNLFSLFKALLTPGKFQDSVLWQKEVLTILALGFCLIAAISFIAFNLISTLKKRQRNYKELVNALEEDGAELDYKLKPLIVDHAPESPPSPKPDKKENNSSNDPKFNKYIEELTSKLEDVSDSQPDPYDPNQIYKDSETSVLTPALSKTEKKVFSLTANHLTANESISKNQAENIIHLSIANLKAEPADSYISKNEVAPIDNEDINQEFIDTSNVNSAVKNAPENSEDNNSSIASPDDDISSNEINSPSDEKENNFKFTDEYENLDEESSIWDEVEEVIADINNFEPDIDAENHTSQNESDESIDDESNDSIGMEVDSIISEFSGEEVGESHEEIVMDSDFNEPLADSASLINSIENSKSTEDDFSQAQQEDNEKILSNTKKTVEFLPLEDDSSNEDDYFIPEANSSEMAESETYGEFRENIDQPISRSDIKNIISTEIPLESTEKIIEKTVEEGVDGLTNCFDDQNILSSEKWDLSENIDNEMEDTETVVFENYGEDIKNNFDQQSKTKHNAPESSNIEACDQKAINQLLLDFEMETKKDLSKPNEKNNSAPAQPKIADQGDANHLSPKTARRIIERLEFFKKNINKTF
jgi:hypothetical protein